MTNFKTIRKSIQKFKEIEKTLGNEESHLTKKEVIRLERQRRKMDRAFGGIKDMENLPDALFVVDTVHEHIAIKEANRLGIPVVAVVDTNSDPEEVDFPIPGNDDAIRAIRLFTSRIADNVLEGLNLADERFVGDEDDAAGAETIEEVEGDAVAAAAPVPPDEATEEPAAEAVVLAEEVVAADAEVAVEEQAATEETVEEVAAAAVVEAESESDDGVAPTKS